MARFLSSAAVVSLLAGAVPAQAVAPMVFGGPGEHRGSSPPPLGLPSAGHFCCPTLRARSISFNWIGSWCNRFST